MSKSMLEHSFKDNKYLPHIVSINERYYVLHKEMPYMVSYSKIKNTSLISDLKSYLVKLRFKDNNAQTTLLRVTINNIDTSADEPIEAQIDYALGTQKDWSNIRKQVIIKSLKSANKRLMQDINSINNNIGILQSEFDIEELDKIDLDINKINNNEAIVDKYLKNND